MASVQRSACQGAALACHSVCVPDTFTHRKSTHKRSTQKQGRGPLHRVARPMHSVPPEQPDLIRSHAGSPQAAARAVPGHEAGQAANRQPVAAPAVEPFPAAVPVLRPLQVFVPEDVQRTLTVPESIRSKLREYQVRPGAAGGAPCRPSGCASREHSAHPELSLTRCLCPTC